MTQQPADPLIRFVIGGVQKAGTTALARYLGRHPDMALPEDKEAHLFDAPDFDEAWTQQQIDARQAAFFSASALDALHGDATPFYIFHPRVVARIARYNPSMRWIVLLRDPVDRALSHHQMERARGTEHRSFWIALLLERWRLHGHADDFRRGSPLRRYSYRARGEYSRQLATLYRHFPKTQVLLVRNVELMVEPHATVARVCRFLGKQAPAEQQDYSPVFAGDYRRWPDNGWRRRVLCWWWRGELEAQAELGLRWNLP